MGVKIREANVQAMLQSGNIHNKKDSINPLSLSLQSPELAESELLNPLDSRKYAT